jgi:hypothetical protein
MRLARPQYGISRIDQPAKRNHGWFVRVTLNGVVQSRFFADKSCGGKSVALDLARSHRDSLVKRLPRERLQALNRRRRNVKQSGVKGITHVVTQDQRGTSYEYWQAAWTGRDGRRHTAKFSVNEYGDRKALDMARKHLSDLGVVVARRTAGKPARKK